MLQKKAIGEDIIISTQLCRNFFIANEGLSQSGQSTNIRCSLDKCFSFQKPKNNLHVYHTFLTAVKCYHSFRRGERVVRKLPLEKPAHVCPHTYIPTHTPKKSGFPGIDPLFCHQSSCRYPLSDKQNTALASF